MGDSLYTFVWRDACSLVLSGVEFVHLEYQGRCQLRQYVLIEEPPFFCKKQAIMSRITIQILKQIKSSLHRTLRGFAD